MVQKEVDIECSMDVNGRYLFETSSIDLDYFYGPHNDQPVTVRNIRRALEPFELVQPRF